MDPYHRHRKLRFGSMNPPEQKAMMNFVKMDNCQRIFPDGKVGNDCKKFGLGDAENIVNKAQQMGADSSECFIQSGSSTGISIEKGQIKKISSGSTAGFGIRIIKDGRLGFSYSTSLDKCEHAIQMALKISRVAPVKDWEFPQSGTYPEVGSTYCDDIAFMTEGSIIDRINLAIDGARDTDEDVKVAEGGGGFGVSHMGIVNSNGISYEKKDTGISIFLSCRSKVDNFASGSEFGESSFDDLDPFGIGAEAGRKTLDLKGAKPAPELGKSEVILLNEAAWEIMENVLVPAFSGPAVNEMRSYLKRYQGERIMSKDISIINDPFLKNGFNTTGADDEGTPSRMVPLVSNGEVANLLYDSFTAQKFKGETTSSGFRASAFSGGRSFRNPPAVNASNVVFRSRCTMELEDMIDEVQRGIMVHEVLGAHTANRNSGDYSINSSKLFYIEKGEIKYPIRSAMLSGNILDLLKNIDCSAEDDRIMSGGMSSACSKIPSIRVKELTVTCE